VSDKPWYQAMIGFPAESQEQAESLMEQMIDVLGPDWVASLSQSPSLSRGEGPDPDQEPFGEGW
jgi:hypothetical protein